MEFDFVEYFRNRLMRAGRTIRLRLFEDFLIFLKKTYSVDSLRFLQRRFLTTFILPYRLYQVMLSNRTYLFPGPILSDEHYHAFLFKQFGMALKKRNERGYINRFFFELIYFLQKNPESYLYKVLENVVMLGFENRAYLHYRWLLKRSL